VDEARKSPINAAVTSRRAALHQSNSEEWRRDRTVTARVTFAVTNMTAGTTWFGEATDTAAGTASYGTGRFTIAYRRRRRRHHALESGRRGNLIAPGQRDLNAAVTEGRQPDTSGPLHGERNDVGQNRQSSDTALW